MNKITIFTVGEAHYKKCVRHIIYNIKAIIEAAQEHLAYSIEQMCNK